MNFLWPGGLVLLGLIPLIAGVYIWMIRRRRRFTVRYSSLALVREALPRHSWVRRHLPFMLFLMALTTMALAFARPAAVVQVPAGQATVILALAVSRSMCMTDIPPNRLEAAKEAAVSFLKRQPPTTRGGVVAFAGFGELVQPPVNDQEMLETAIAGLTTGRRTAIGSGIIEALDAIAEIVDNVPATDEQVLPDTGADLDEPYAPAIIVLLTDGVSNAGPHPLEAAQLAVERRIRIYTIGYGTDNENQDIPDCGRNFWGGGSWGGGSFWA
ncbi:MAG: VWA domain-containing protein, partial [Chloroflexi bacterium]|nr:VWA domain-containing protein [Chloroflexota bacterium]